MYKQNLLSCWNNHQDNLDINRQVRSTYARGNLLISKFRNCDDNVKVKLFKAFCTSFYGGGLWINYFKCQFKKLSSAFNRIFRQLFRINDYKETTYTMLQLCIDPV